MCGEHRNLNGYNLLRAHRMLLLFRSRLGWKCRFVEINGVARNFSGRSILCT